MPLLPCIFVSAAAATLSATTATRNYPQYILLNKAVGSGDPLAWNQANPASVSQASVNEILRALGTNGTAARRLGVSAMVSVTNDCKAGACPNATHAFVRNVLALSLANDLPIALTIDPFEWWDGRPDLWNFFNASAPGYNPANIQNVEWTSFDPADAVTIAWRDWGSQMRTVPHPNLASPGLLGEYTSAVRPIASDIAAWYAALPPARRYLLAGVRVGWEVDIGVNYYFYPGGNAYRTQPPASDPKSGVSGAVQQGFNAVCTMMQSQKLVQKGDGVDSDLGPSSGQGREKSLTLRRKATGASVGQQQHRQRHQRQQLHQQRQALQQQRQAGCTGTTLTAAQLDAVVRAFFTLLADALRDEGIPRSKLFTHAGADFGDLPHTTTSTSGAVYRDLPTSTSSPLLNSGASRGPLEGKLQLDKHPRALGKFGLGQEPPTELKLAAGVVWNSPADALTPAAQPGWSFYTYAFDPSKAGHIDAALDGIDGSQWACAEWLYLGGNNGTVRDQWSTAFANSLGYRNNRFVSVFNWEGVKGNADALAGLRDALSDAASPACLVEPVAGLSVTIAIINSSISSSSFNVTISWVLSVGSTDDDAKGSAGRASIYVAASEDAGSGGAVDGITGIDAADMRVGAAVTGAAADGITDTAVADMRVGGTGALGTQVATSTMTVGTAAAPEVLTLDVSPLSLTLPSGALASPTVVTHADVSGRTSTWFVLDGGYTGTTLYASVVSRGCSGQMMATDAVEFTLPAV